MRRLFSIVLISALIILSYSGFVLSGELETVLEKAERGNSNAQNYLGLMYAKGSGVSQDYKQAFHWFSKAAENGNAPAHNNLGMMYYKAKGVIQDYNRALFWFKKAADMGYVDAQYNLGMMYYSGRHDPFDNTGVKQDYKQAFHWFKKAAGQDHASAHNSIGIMYLKGHGVKQDLKKSYIWNHKAIELGNQNAIRVRKKILNKLTPQQKAEAQEEISKQKEKLDASD